MYPVFTDKKRRLRAFTQQGAHVLLNAYELFVFASTLCLKKKGGQASGPISIG